MADNNAASTWSRMDIISACVIGVLTLVAIVGGVVSYQANSPFGLGIAVGALGGLVHEIAQSRGTVLFLQKKVDGLYLGAISGVILGAVAGVLVALGDDHFKDLQGLTVAIFSAGLALKGVAEAATTEAVPVQGSPTPEEEAAVREIVDGPGDAG